MSEYPDFKAYRITCPKVDDGEAGIYVAKTRNQAMAKALRNLRELGYQVGYINIKCLRAPEYDQWATKQNAHRLEHGMVEEYVKMELNRERTT